MPIAKGSEMTLTQHAFLASLAGIGVGAVLIAAVCLSGQTFGQRCEKTQPCNAVAQAECVRRLAHG